MKNLYLITFYSLLILFIGCSEERIQNDIQEIIPSNSIEKKLEPSDPSDPINLICTDTATDLMAGQNTDSGNVVVTETDGILDITYETEGDWVILETHLYVGIQENMPATNPGNPRIGQFPYSTDHGNGVTTFTYSIPVPEGDSIWVAAHAVVYNTSTGQEETAWGYGVDIDGNSWAMWFEVCNGEGGGPF